MLYLGYIDGEDDLDLYGFDATPLAQVGVRLSHLAGDGDLVVYGPATDRPGNSPSPGADPHRSASRPRRSPPRTSTSPATGYAPEPDADAGVPILDGLTVVGKSAGRSADVEAVDAIEPDLLQVSSYNASTSNLPYVLRVRDVDPPTTPACTAYARTGGVAGTLPDLTALPADLATIILVNQQRLGDTFGAAAADDVMASLAELRRAARRQGRGDPRRRRRRRRRGVRRVERQPVPRRSGQQGGQRDHPARRRHPQRRPPGVAAHPALANVVVVGGDDIIPMARLDDTTRVGNETGYADEFDVNGPYHGALGTSHFLSDDPYGDLDPIQWATRRLYVPELAVGRLVETPDEIIAQLDAFTGAAGRLDASRAYAAGYDFMTDGARSVRATLERVAVHGQRRRRPW